MSLRKYEAFGARRLETAAQGAVEAAEAGKVPVLLVFCDVAVEVAPGDDVQSAIAAHDAAVAAIVERETDHPLLSDVPPQRGDVVETLEHDHFTRIPKGTIGLVSATTEADGAAASHITVRFAVRAVDYESADFERLQHARRPVR